jgi:hypothetical protein
MGGGDDGPPGDFDRPATSIGLYSLKGTGGSSEQVPAGAGLDGDTSEAAECEGSMEAQPQESAQKESILTLGADALTCACLGSCRDGRPTMQALVQGAKVYMSASTPCSSALAAQVKEAALATSKIHGYSTAGTPWLYAKRMAAIKDQNTLFLSWCKEWISELYGVSASKVYAARTEPHIVKYW